MHGPYVQPRRDGLLFIKGTRIPLAAVAYAFRQGESPETIRQSFPVLSLEQVYGAITFCLAYPQELNDYLDRLTRLEDEAERSTPPPSPRLRRALARAQTTGPARASPAVRA